ncbi:hypothetical protein CROQUDRAFT_658474 [Cronartium quercuum f. sp. fusiforme G11]|uniref:CRAL-TRIO domain-containing protein n=1 Tax=Cronartium quercuum f. sp. fusiforme G11 TaxID=708437 RepID=A0A9P6TBC5_9BASI|nr:hypothetical protein CROQUDRAFT_658474 [Cronartium quercuum f. sp. fusiforme G11]
MSSSEGNPLPSTGVVGRLTLNQYNSLKSFWKEFFKLIDQAPEKGTWKPGDQQQQQQQQGEEEIEPEIDHKINHEPILNNESKAQSQPLDEKLRSEQELNDAKLALEKYGKVKFLETFWGMIMMDDPDVIVLKFLRARKWNVSAGVAMMASCMKWRIEFGVDKTLEKGEEGLKDCEGFINQMKMGKSFIQGTDKLGRPIVYITVRLHKSSDTTTKSLEQYIIYVMESVRLMLIPPIIEKTTIVIDMTGFGLANMDWKSLAFILKCLESYYPESLNVLLVHNAPWIFQGVWKIISPMLDPVVRSKIRMTKTAEELKVHIDERHLVNHLGGTNDWTWSYEPVQPSENEKMSDLIGKARELNQRKHLANVHMDITRQWCEDIKTDQASVISEHEKENEIMAPDMSEKALLRTLAMYHLRAQYFVLDPYIRGRSVYHRRGNVVGNGLITFQYPRVRDESGEEIDEWEVSGYQMSRESLLILIQNLKSTLDKRKISYPNL